MLWAAKKIAVGKAEEFRNQKVTAGDANFGNVSPDEASRREMESATAASKLEEEARQAREKAVQAREEADAAQADARRIAGESAATKRTIDRVGSNEDGAAEARREAERIRAEKREADRKAVEDEKQRREAQREIEREGKGIPGAVEKGTKGARDVPVTRAVNEATEKLKDGATADEYAGIARALDEFVSAAGSMGAGQKAQLSNLTKTVRNLAERLRRLEGK